MKKQFINILCAILGLLIFTSATIAQEGVVALVGNKKIDSREFIKRFEFTPKVEVDSPKDSSKINFLYSMIAEKLWAIEGEKLGLQNSEYVKNSLNDMLHKLMLDKLYKQEIEHKVKVFPSEIKEDLPKAQLKLTLKFMSSKDKNEIDRLYNKLKNGVAFDSLLLKRKEALEQGNGIEIYYGDMAPELESRVFKLNVGESTEPLLVAGQWVIYYMEQKEKIKTHPKFPNKKPEKIAEEVIFARKAKIEYKQFFNTYVKGKEVKTDKQLFGKLADALYRRLQNNSAKAFNPNDKKYYMNYYQILSVKQEFSQEELNRNFVKFKAKPVSLGNFIDRISIDGLSVKEVSREAFISMLSGRVKRFIFNELLLRLAEEKGLQNDSEIKADLDKWRESFIASYYRNRYLDSVAVDNSEVRNYYEQIKNILPDSLKNNYDYVQKKISSSLYFKKLKELYELKTANLAVKYGVKINRNLLNALKVTDVEMIVYRTLGFGGSITAVPYLTPFYSWYKWMPKKIKQKNEKGIFE